MKPPIISITTADSLPIESPQPEVPKKITRKLYRIESSHRLTNKLVNPYQKDILATVGTYNPYPPNEKKLGKGWGLSARFQKDTEVTDLGPCKYNPFIPDSKVVSSPFISSTTRFRPQKSTTIAPGSYDLEIEHVSPVWKPWVVNVSSRLGRVMEKQEKKTVPGTGPEILKRLSRSVPKSEFMETKQRIQNKGEKPKEEIKTIKMGLDTKASTSNPYSFAYFVQSISIPSHLPPLP